MHWLLQYTTSRYRSLLLFSGLDFDLALYDAQTDEELRDDTAQIARNASLVVRRVPAGEHQKQMGRVAARYLAGAVYTRRGVQMAGAGALPQSGAGGGATGAADGLGSATGDAATDGGTAPATTATGYSSTAPLAATAAAMSTAATIEGETEEDRIMALMQQSSDQWQQQSQQLAVYETGGVELCVHAIVHARVFCVHFHNITIITIINFYDYAIAAVVLSPLFV